MTEENLVPDDDLKSTIPDAIVTIEEPKPEAENPKATVTELPKDITKDAAAEGVEELAKNLEAEKKRREAAEQRAANEGAARVAAEQKASVAENRISKEVQQNIDANRTAAQNAIAAAQAIKEQAKKDFIALQAEGKFDEAFEATQKAAEATATIKGAENYLSQLEAQVEQIKNSTTVTENPQVQQSDDSGIIDKITGIKFTPTTYAWVDKHKSQWADQDFRVECDAAARVAKKKGLAVDTPQYFEFIEQRLQREGYLEMLENEENDSPPKKVEAPQRKMSAASMGAAPTRSVPGTKSVPAKGIKLSGIEREIAKSFAESLPDVYGKDANPDQIWARNKMAIQQESENE